MKRRSNQENRESYVRSSGFWQGRAGGGAFCADGGVASNCAAYGCSAYWGGGFFCGAQGTAISCVAAYNGAVEGAGFCAVEGGMLMLCKSTGNAGDWGAGVDLYNATADAMTVLDNTATYGAGAVVAMEAEIRNSLVARNTAAKDAGGIRMETPCTIRNCTVARNLAGTSGGGVNVFSGGLVVNSILSTNASASGGSNLAYMVAAPEVMYSCVLPGAGGSGNIAADPRFRDAANGNYRLLTESPCINAGTNSLVVGTRDADGLPRKSGGVVDIGAFENAATGMYVVGVVNFDDAFGGILVSNSAVLAVWVENIGAVPFSGSVLGVAPPFSVTGGSPYTVAAYSSNAVWITFLPTDLRTYSNQVTFTGVDAGASVWLEGSGVPEPACAAVLAVLAAVVIRMKRNGHVRQS